MNLNPIVTPGAENPVESPSSGSSMPSGDKTPKQPTQAQAAKARHLAGATTQTKEAMEMLKVSRDSASQRQDAGPVVDLRDELDGYTVSLRRFSRTSTRRPS